VVVLNASRLKANKEGIITLISPYDGSKTRFDYPQLIEIIHHLKPEAVILPADILKVYPQIWDNWAKEIMPFLSSNDLVVEYLPQTYGVYFTLKECSSQIKEQLQNYKKLPRYVQGSLSLEQMNELRLLGINVLESDEPARLGLDGLAYEHKKVIDLKDKHYAQAFEPISSECQCPTCTTQLTKAYLHHLYLHTPLLCQRFLIQHNAWQVQHI
jgi:queuine tRNA-ribosyltransferase